MTDSTAPTRADRLAALSAERLDQTWWPTPAPSAAAQRASVLDDDLTTARRRRLLSRECDAMTAAHRTEVS